MENYKKTYQKSIENPVQFWGDAAKMVDWITPYKKVLVQKENDYEWFHGGQLNTCYNMIDRHILNGLGENNALVYDSPVTNTKQKYTYNQLKSRVEKIAGMLQNAGVVAGDRIIIYMPMIPESVMGMLACARLGAIHSVVFGGFSAKELSIRIDDAQPKVILSASCGIETNRIIKYKPLLDDAITLSTHPPQRCIIFQREEEQAPLEKNRDFDWKEEEKKAMPVDPVAVDSNAPLYILYTSGTTGKPKGVVRDNGGHAVALCWSMKYIYNIKAGDCYWAASDIGWVVGHSYIVYAPLLIGCTTVIYEGKPVKTPDPGAFWRVCEEYQVNCLFTAPTAFRAIKKEDPQAHFAQKYDLSHLKSIFVAGERCDSDTLHWLEEKTQKPVIDHWWQTETGWAIVSNFLGMETLPFKAGSSTVPVPGYALQILDKEANQCQVNQLGNISIKLPLPPSVLNTLWNNKERFIDSYLSTYQGYYLTGDFGSIDEDGYVWIMGRIDDVINVAGHRLSTGEIEEVLSKIQEIAECAVIGVKDNLKGEIPFGFIVLKENVDKPHADIIKYAIDKVREDIGPIVSFKNAIVVQQLPKTRSGKILRGIMKAIFDETPWKMPATLEDENILIKITEKIKEVKNVI